jgi:hypothetical protein
MVLRVQVFDREAFTGHYDFHVEFIFWRPYGVEDFAVECIYADPESVHPVVAGECSPRQQPLLP